MAILRRKKGPRASFWYTSVAFAIASGLVPAVARSNGATSPFQWHVAPVETTIAVGETLRVVCTLSIAPEHHAYAERTSISVDAPDGLWVGEPTATPPVVSFDRFEGRDVPQYADSAVYRVPMVASSALTGARAVVKMTLRTQGCSRTQCYFPMREERTIAIDVRPGAPGGVIASGYTAETSDDDAFDLGHVLAERGILLALGIMFVGGVLTSFTPCVLPIIPLTVSFFGASRTTPLRGLALSLVFVLGMAAMYSALGVGAAATGALFGSIMQNPVVVSLIAVLFVAFAASMFGAFTIRLPASAQARLQRVGGVGFLGAFFAGLVTGIIAAPCTGPVLGAALVYVATTGALWFGFAAMFTFAVGMGLLFIAIGTFSASIIPKPGPWTEKIESIFGIIMLAAALYFLSNVLPPLKAAMRPGVGALAVSLALVAVGVLLGAVHLRFVAGVDREGNPLPAPTWGERLRKAFGVLLTVAGLYGATGAFLAPQSSATGLPEPEWVYDDIAGLEAAQREGKPVLMDFYAEWCIACKELDHKTYANPAVREHLRDFISIKLDLTEQTPKTETLARKYGISGLPTVIVFDSLGRERWRWTGFIGPEKLLEQLQSVR